MSIWHTQNAFENNGLYVCRKGRFDGETGVGEWGMSAKTGSISLVAYAIHDLQEYWGECLQETEPVWKLTLVTCVTRSWPAEGRFGLIEWVVG